jgi:protein-disulfide isomerase
MAVPFRTMASGKKSKQMRRAQSAPPPVQSKGAPRRRQASPRVLMAAAGVVALVAIGIVLAVVLSGGSSTPKVTQATGSIANGLPGAADVDGFFKGIPQAGMVLGSPSATVSMIEYIDLQCPFCEQFDTQVFPDIVKRYVKTGKVKVEVRVLDFIGPDSSRGRKAMTAAGLQNKAFNFAELLYFNQATENTGWLDDKMVIAAAESIPGLNVPKLLADRNSSTVAKLASAADANAVADKVSSTPTLLVGRTGSKPKVVGLASPSDEATLVAALDTALAG